MGEFFQIDSLGTSIYSSNVIRYSIVKLIYRPTDPEFLCKRCSKALTCSHAQIQRKEKTEFSTVMSNKIAMQADTVSLASLKQTLKSFRQSSLV